MSNIKKFRIKSFKNKSEILKLEKISLKYGRKIILDNLNLQLGNGEILGLLGPNGAGKTTLFNIICGLISPDFGSVYINSKKVNEYQFYKEPYKATFTYVRQSIMLGLGDAILTGEPLIGATVLIGKGIGTVTDFDGKFSIVADYGEYELSISYVGFESTMQSISLDRKILLIKEVKLSPSISYMKCKLIHVLLSMRKQTHNLCNSNIDLFDKYIS